jgi:nitrogen fixation protein FixH
MTAAPGFRVKGWHVAAGVTAFFTLVIAVDATFMVLAYRTHPGQVAGKPYEDGLVYNARLARERTQSLLGWKASAEAQPGRVVVWMRDRHGFPVDGLEIAVTLERPATERGKTTLRLVETEPGRYASNPAALTGTWDSRIVALSAEGQDFEANRRLTWR